MKVHPVSVCLAHGETNFGISTARGPADGGPILSLAWFTSSTKTFVAPILHLKEIERITALLALTDSPI
jgi:hypothetical protein